MEQNTITVLGHSFSYVVESGTYWFRIDNIAKYLGYYCHPETGNCPAIKSGVQSGYGIGLLKCYQEKYFNTDNKNYLCVKLSGITEFGRYSAKRDSVASTINLKNVLLKNLPLPEQLNCEHTENVEVVKRTKREKVGVDSIDVVNREMVTVNFDNGRILKCKLRYSQGESSRDTVCCVTGEILREGTHRYHFYSKVKGYGHYYITVKYVEDALGNPPCNDEVGFFRKIKNWACGKMKW